MTRIEQSRIPIDHEPQLVAEGTNRQRFPFFLSAIRRRQHMTVRIDNASFARTRVNQVREWNKKMCFAQVEVKRRVIRKPCEGCRDFAVQRKLPNSTTSLESEKLGDISSAVMLCLSWI